MFIPAIFTGDTSSGATGDERSLRFRATSGSTQYMQRQHSGSDGNQKKWTLSLWLKIGSISTAAFHNGPHIWATGNSNPTGGGGFTTYARLVLGGASGNQIGWQESGGANSAFQTNNLLRDPSAWYHILVRSDNANTVIQCKINGVEASYASRTNPTNTDGNVNKASYYDCYGIFHTGDPRAFQGYLTECYLVDGEYLDYTDFTQLDSNGILIPKAYAGSLGTHGYYLDFRDASTTTTLGYDAGGSNDFTTANFSVTSGTTYDSMYDYPVNGTSGSSGVIGNYCTLNPLVASAANISKANLASGTTAVRGSIPASAFTASGAYWEVTAGGSAPTCGVISESGTTNTTTVTANKVFGFRLTNAGALDYINITDAGSWTSITTGLTGNQYPYGVTQAADWNFGQRPLSGTPSGQSMCTANLPTPTILKPKQHFDIKTRSGTGASATITTNSDSETLLFQPDLVWTKARSAATSHYLTDAVRGVTKSLNSNGTGAEATDANGITAFASTPSYTVGSDTNYNNSIGPVTYVDWLWKANGAGSSNTAGTITSTVSANTTAGFSIVAYQGNGTNGATVGHGLNSAPEFVIYMRRTDGGEYFPVYHKNLTSAAYNLFLQLTNAQAADGALHATGPSSTLLTLTASVRTNASTKNYVALCMHGVEGFSKFGSYTGNGSSDGPFVYCGFRPRYVLLKNASTGGAGYEWFIYDTARDTYNVCTKDLLASNTDVENSYSQDIDITANGFKVRYGNAATNGNTDTIIFAAFAESPFALNNRAR